MDPKLSNNSFMEKVKVIAGDLHVPLNDELTSYPKWGHREIERRGAHLAELAIRIWMGPDEAFRATL